MDKEQTAIMRLQQASEMSLAVYEQPLMICHSGGKDSAVLAELAHRAGIPYELSHSHTTADAPETVRHVRSEFKRISESSKGCVEARVVYPTYKGVRTSMWALIPQKKMPPTRLARYCCAVLKETAGTNRFIATGVRWDESVRRASTRGIYETLTRSTKNKLILNNDNDDARRLFESCSLKAQRVVNPIVDWLDKDIWDFCESEHLPMNPLYECETRVGCIGCPMASKHAREREFARYPEYKRAYIRAFDKMLEVRKAEGKDDSTGAWKSAQDVFNWWMEYDLSPGQISFDDMEDDE